ncbi:MAG TPA: response regulator [Anaerolineaceae bacterium]|nr:response regulator [Anaerolineaceae bacterium]
MVLNQSNASILIIDDDQDLGEMLNSYFEVQGYQVSTINWGEDGLRSCIEKTPDVVLLDIRLPDLDGYEIVKRLKNNRRTQTVPIIFLTEKRQREDRLRGLAMEVEDYITKPFDIQELRLRVRNVLMRYRRSSLTNAITGLPEKQLLIETMEENLQSKKFGMIIVSLQKMDDYRDLHGFVAANEVLRNIVQILKELFVKNEDEVYLAQWGNPNFILLTKSEQTDQFEKTIYQSLFPKLEKIYPLRDNHTGRIEQQLGLKILKKNVNPNNESLQKIILDIERLIN